MAMAGGHVVGSVVLSQTRVATREAKNLKSQETLHLPRFPRKEGYLRPEVKRLVYTNSCVTLSLGERREK